MTTVAEKPDRSAAERRFFGRMAIAILIVVFIGFAPSFYLSQAFSYPRPNPPLTATTMTHGLVFTAWLVTFYAQIRLVAAKRLDVHRRLGMWAFALALAMVPVAYLTSVQAIPRNTQPPIMDALGWSAVPLLTLVAMAFLFFMGWRNRKQPQAHKRFMLLATLAMLEPGLSRWPIFPPDMTGHVVADILAFCFAIPLLLWDRRTLGQLHWATKVGLAALAFGCFARFLVWNTEAWRGFAAMLPG
jgi:hypothetical protein